MQVLLSQLLCGRTMIICFILHCCVHYLAHRAARFLPVTVTTTSTPITSTTYSTVTETTTVTEPERRTYLFQTQILFNLFTIYLGIRFIYNQHTVLYDDCHN